MKSVRVILALLAFLLLSAGSIGRAQTSTHFDLTWHVVGGGGGSASSAGYRVTGTVGQSVVSQIRSSSAGFHVSGGYWIPYSQQRIYLPAVLNE
jgi:hypothetical protein